MRLFIHKNLCFRTLLVYSNYSNGFFASKVTAISASAGTDDQWGCMAKGGFAGEGTPYYGAYWDAYTESTSDTKTCEVYTSAPYYAVGCYVCNNPYVYYAIEKGNASRLNSSREIGLNSLLTVSMSKAQRRNRGILFGRLPF